MAKGYWVASLDVKDEADYAEYRKRNAKVFAQYGGRFLVRGGVPGASIGKKRSHIVVIEFSTYEAALACFNSLEYQAAKAYLSRGTNISLVVLPEYEGEQPG